MKYATKAALLDDIRTQYGDRSMMHHRRPPAIARLRCLR
jgi:hypothetical protein